MSQPRLRFAAKRCGRLLSLGALYASVAIAACMLLIIADRCYFLAVGNPDALISIITVLRRSSVFISFLAGIIIFRERKSKLKFIALLGVVAGLCLISLGKG